MRSDVKTWSALLTSLLVIAPVCFVLAMIFGRAIFAMGEVSFNWRMFLLYVLLALVSTASMWYMFALLPSPDRRQIYPVIVAWLCSIVVMLITTLVLRRVRARQALEPPTPPYTPE
jgi:branched-subunit amino acid ABC-type transport system permease component